MKNVLNVVRRAWCSPVTFLSSIFLVSASKFDLCDYIGEFGDARVWVINRTKFKKDMCEELETEPLVLGRNVVMHAHPHHERYNSVTLKHAQCHVAQWMRFGPTMLFVRPILKLVLAMLTTADTYYDDPFEIAARRASGQTVDVPGVKKKLAEAVKKSQRGI